MCGARKASVALGKPGFWADRYRGGQRMHELRRAGKVLGPAQTSRGGSATLLVCTAETALGLSAARAKHSVPFAVHHFCAGAGEPFAALHNDHLQTHDIEYSC